ncbi:hypothetical protein MACH17_31340 [Phaeobacter inhibens]|nr:hypothetical protein MACH17_31340 [Phaeobacter inhibens]
MFINRVGPAVAGGRLVGFGVIRHRGFFLSSIQNLAAPLPDAAVWVKPATATPPL